MLPFIKSELAQDSYIDFELEFGQQINSLFLQDLDKIREFQKFKTYQILKLKQKVLAQAVEDIMQDYQRLTHSESQKFDGKYGQMLQEASKLVYMNFGEYADTEENVDLFIQQ